MKFAELKRKVARAIDRNDRYDPLYLVAEYLDWEEYALGDLDSARYEHERNGSLTLRAVYQRDRFTKVLKEEFIKSHGEDKWYELRI